MAEILSPCRPGKTQRPIVVRDTVIVPSDTRQQYRQKIAITTLDSMVQFVGLLDAHGTVLERQPA